MYLDIFNELVCGVLCQELSIIENNDVDLPSHIFMCEIPPAERNRFLL